MHALNILRAMFKDTRLGDDVAPYIADGLKVAILGFKSPLWSVSNFKVTSTISYHVHVCLVYLTLKMLLLNPCKT